MTNPVRSYVCEACGEEGIPDERTLCSKRCGLRYLVPTPPPASPLGIDSGYDRENPGASA